MNVHILVTCRNPDLWKFSALVFDTIRVGFPTSTIHIWENNTSWEVHSEVYHRLGSLEDVVTHVNDKTHELHDEWIQQLIETEVNPFWIVDTDVVFFDNMETEYYTNSAMAGTFIPKFRDPYTQYLTVQKLHTCVMTINPRVIKESLKPKSVFYAPDQTEPPITARRKLFKFGHSMLHHDTMSEIYHSLGGEEFQESTKNKFGHINCGTYADRIDNYIPGYLARCHKLADNPRLLKGIWRDDEAFYKSHPWPDKC